MLIGNSFGFGREIRVSFSNLTEFIQLLSNVDPLGLTSITIVMVDSILLKSTIQRRLKPVRAMQTLHETMNLISPVDPPRAGRNAATRAVLISGPIMVLVCLVLCLFSVATPTELTAQEPVADANAAALTALDDASLSDTERVILRTVQELSLIHI